MRKQSQDLPLEAAVPGISTITIISMNPLQAEMLASPLMSMWLTTSLLVIITTATRGMKTSPLEGLIGPQRMLYPVGLPRPPSILLATTTIIITTITITWLDRPRPCRRLHFENPGRL